MSWLCTAKSVPTKGSLRKCGGRRGKVVVLIPGDLSGGHALAWMEGKPPCDRCRSDAMMDSAEVSRGHSSERIAHEGPNVKQRADVPTSGGRADRSQLTVGESSAEPTW